MTDLPLSNSLLVPLRQCDHLRGTLNQPITLMAYGDYQCPRSAQVYATVRDVYSNFNDQLCIIYRHDPQTPERTAAWKAAEAAEAAAAQGKFWEMHDTLYQHSQELEDSNLVEYADQLDLNIPQFLSELSNHTFAEKIKSDIYCGEISGITEVPTYFINIRSGNAQYLGSLLQTVVDLNHMIEREYRS